MAAAHSAQTGQNASKPRHEKEWRSDKQSRTFILQLEGDGGLEAHLQLVGHLVVLPRRGRELLEPGPVDEGEVRLQRRDDAAVLIAPGVNSHCGLSGQGREGKGGFSCDTSVLETRTIAALVAVGEYVEVDLGFHAGVYAERHVEGKRDGILVRELMAL
jgi:hypothetical protein